MRGSFSIEFIVIMVLVLAAAVFTLFIYPKISHINDAVTAQSSACAVGEQVTAACACNGQRVEPQASPVYCCADGALLKPCPVTA